MYRVGITIFTVGIALLLGAAGAAYADWEPGDPYKMHFPQLPDPNGWDVNATVPLVLADDWMCTETGAVSDVHFWGSWQNDVIGQIVNAHLSIHADVPAGDQNPFSHPGALLWSWDVEPTLIGTEPASPQGWFDPASGQFEKPNHSLWFQYNIVNIPDPYIQQVGTIYWLDISVTTTGGTWGWKTSLNHFNDDAVWSSGGSWAELVDPLTAESLDLAFVITPEPSGALLLLAGSTLLLARHRRRRA
jgi:hypothetical protein